MRSDVSVLSRLERRQRATRDRPVQPARLPIDRAATASSSAPRSEVFTPKSGQNPGMEAGSSRLNPGAGWRRAAFCTEGEMGQGEPRNFVTNPTVPFRRRTDLPSLSEFNGACSCQRAPSRRDSGREGAITLSPEAASSANLTLPSSSGRSRGTVLLVPGSFAGRGEEAREQLAEVIGPHAVEVVLAFAARLDQPGDPKQAR